MKNLWFWKCDELKKKLSIKKLEKNMKKSFFFLQKKLMQ